MKTTTRITAASRHPLRNTLLAVVVGLAPMAAANAVSPLGFELPTPGTPGPLPAVAASTAPRGVSPLGWEIPPPGPRGAQGPLR